LQAEPLFANGLGEESVMRVLKFSILIVILALCMGAQKADHSLYVLPSWQDLTAGPEGKALVGVLREEDLRGTELRFITKEVAYTDGSTRTFGEEDDR